jgi:antitoxin CptB
MSSSLSDTPPVLSDRVRRLIYQASYTGMKETDLLLGHFAKSYLADLSDDDLTDFENLLAAGDHLIYAWVTGNEAVPDAYNTPVFKLIKNFKDSN